MKINFKTAVFVAFAILLILSMQFYSNWIQAKKTNARLDKNFNILAAEFNSLKKQSVTVGVLEMTKKEIKGAFPELEEHIKKEFNQKLKNIQTYSNTQTVVNHTFETTLKDSLINDTIKVKSFNYSDAWLKFNAYQKDSIVKITKNEIPVPLEQIVYREKWKLFHPFRKRPLSQQIKTANPYATIDFQRIIQITKK